MDKVDYLVNVLTEECCEVGQRACKAVRFGLYETQEGHTQNNLQRLIGELNDILGTIETLQEEGVDFSEFGDRMAVDRKKASIKKYFTRSIEHGKLEE